jgi:diadenylate cyclase
VTPAFFGKIRWQDALDVAIVAAVLYRLLVALRGTRALQVLAALALLLGATVLARRFELAGTGFLLENLWSFWLIVLVVLFQPELRRVLAQVGRGPLLGRLLGASRAERTHVVDDVVKGAESLAARRIGALVVFERTMGLGHYAELGVRLDALVSPDLLASIFLPYSPLHDGAVVIQGNRLVAAGCFLPLSRNTQLGRTLGTRHRAALGISEETDAIALVVSEETGRVSVVAGGLIEAVHDGEAARRWLGALLGVGVPTAPGLGFFGSLRRRSELRPEAK